MYVGIYHNGVTKFFRQSSFLSSNFHVLWIPESETKKKIEEQIIILVSATRTLMERKINLIFFVLTT
jgi:hypothetical protein